MSIQSLIHTLHKQLSDHTPIEQSQLQEWRKAFPYFSLPLMMYVQENRSKDKESLTLSTIYAGDIEEWATRLGFSRDYSCLYPHCSAQQTSTESTIELFLQTYGKEGEEYETELSIGSLIEPPAANIEVDNTEEQVNAQTPLLTIPVYDYMSQLESMPDVVDAQPLQDEDLLDKFLEADAAGEQLFSRPEFHPTGEISPSEHDNKEGTDTLFSESLAKIYIQQRRYAKALEIIRKLNLNNPEKNAYFADQIRFLEKLIINVKN